MNKILDLLKSLFFDFDNLQKVLASVIDDLLEGIPNLNGCKQRLTDMLKDGTLDDNFKEDPVDVILCLSYVILDILSFYKGHDHDSDESKDQPVYAKGGDDGYYNYLGTLVGVNNYTAGPNFTNLLYSMLLDELLDRLKKYLLQVDMATLKQVWVRLTSGLSK